MSSNAMSIAGRSVSRRWSSPLIRLLASIGILGAAATNAATIDLVASDRFGTSSFTSGVNWSNNLPPSFGDDYAVEGFTIRSPDGVDHATFQGDSLDLTDANLVLDGSSSTLVEVGDLRLRDSWVVRGNGLNDKTLAGEATLSGRVGIDAGAGGEVVIGAAMRGSGAVEIASRSGATSGAVTYAMNPKAYTNGTTIGEAATLQVAIDNAMPLVGTTTVNSGGRLRTNTGGDPSTVLNTQIETLDLRGTLNVFMTGKHGGASDLLTVTDQLLIGLDAILAIDVFDAPLDDAAYVFLDYSGAMPRPFASVIGLPDGYRIDYRYGLDSSIALVAVPLPSTLALLLTGYLLCLVGRRHFR